jgi:hypothetical protein
MKYWRLDPIRIYKSLFGKKVAAQNSANATFFASIGLYFRSFPMNKDGIGQRSHSAVF